MLDPMPNMLHKDPHRSWLAMCGGGLVVLVILGISAFFGRGGPTYSNPEIPLPLDAYAAHLVVANQKLSTALNFAGAPVTYVEGRVTNSGDKTVNNAMVEVIFKSAAGEIAQIEREPLPVIQSRQPYVSTVLLNAAPLSPGKSSDFRLTFERLSRDWNQQYPEVRVISTSLQ